MEDYLSRRVCSSSQKNRRCRIKIHSFITLILRGFICCEDNRQKIREKEDTGELAGE
jgi:hypothetical protein